MKKTILSLAALVATMTALASCQGQSANEGTDPSVVYVTRDLSPESLVKITGYLRPDFIKPLVDEVNGTIVECNTAYPGTRNTTEAHWEAIRERGFLDIAKVDIMDEEGTMKIPVQDTTWLKYDIVGSHLQNYDFMINLAHFKGHQMAGMGGVLKNASIGVASSTGKAYIHSHGVCSGCMAVYHASGCLRRVDGRSCSGCSRLLRWWQEDSLHRRNVQDEYRLRLQWRSCRTSHRRLWYRGFARSCCC